MIEAAVEELVMGLPDVKVAFAFTVGPSTRVDGPAWVAPPSFSGTPFESDLRKANPPIKLSTSETALAGELEVRNWPFSFVDVGINGGYTADASEDPNANFIKSMPVNGYIQIRHKINPKLTIPVRTNFGVEYLFGSGFSLKDFEQHDISTTLLKAGISTGVEYAFMNKYPIAMNFGCQFAPSSDLGYGFMTLGGLSAALNFSVGYILGR